MWIPVFCSMADGRNVINFDVVNKPSQLMEIEESIRLRDQLVDSMISNGRVSSPDQIYMDRLQDAVWKRIRAGLKPTGNVLAYESSEGRIEIPVYENGNTMIAAQRPKVCFGRTDSGLVSAMADVLRMEGAIRSSVSLRFEEKRRN